MARIDYDKIGQEIRNQVNDIDFKRVFSKAIYDLIESWQNIPHRQTSHSVDRNYTLGD